MREKLDNWIIHHWFKYIWKKSTLLFLILLYFDIFHHSSINLLWDNVLGDHNIANAIVSTVMGYFLRSEK